MGAHQSRYRMSLVANKVTISGEWVATSLSARMQEAKWPGWITMAGFTQFTWLTSDLSLWVLIFPIQDLMGSSWIWDSIVCENDVTLVRHTHRVFSLFSSSFDVILFLHSFSNLYEAVFQHAACQEQTQGTWKLISQVWSSRSKQENLHLNWRLKMLEQNPVASPFCCLSTKY